MKRKHLTIALAMLLAAIHAQGQADPINEILSAVVASNPELQSQRELLAAQRAEDSDANALSNPSVAVGRVWGRKGIGNKLQIDVSQSFDWPGLYRMRSLASGQGISAAMLEVANAELQVALEAKAQMLELVYVRKQMAVVDSLRSNIATLAAYSDEAYGKGLINVLDNRKMKFELYKAEAQLASLTARESEIMAQVSGLAPASALDLAAVVAYPIEPVRTSEEYMAQIGDFDPLVAAQRFAMSQQEYLAKAASQSRFPSFSLGYQHQAEMGDRFNGFTASVTLPFFENRHARSAALARQLSAGEAMQSAMSVRQAEVGSDLSQMALWKGEIENYLRVFGDNAYPRLLKIAFEAKEISALDYLAEVNYYQECSLSYLEAEYNYQSALARLNRYDLLELCNAQK